MDLSAFFHARGVNMRYAPQVAARCQNAAARQFLGEERLIRAAKHKIRALWATQARSEAHATALADHVIGLLRRGLLWSQLGAEPPQSWGWERRLRAALGLPLPFVSRLHQHALTLADARTKVPCVQVSCAHAAVLSALLTCARACLLRSV